MSVSTDPNPRRVNQIWHVRWQALHQVLLDLKNNIEQSEQSATRANFISLLENLEVFGWKQFRFFYKGFGGQFTDNPTPPNPFIIPAIRRDQKLESPLNYTIDHVLRVTTDQIAYDLSVIQQAWQQRTSMGQRQKETLRLADALGVDLLCPTIKSGMIGDTTVITYFQKSPVIRLIPYDNVALVGIPLTSSGSKQRDMLALSHELGHYIFWHGFVEGNRLALLLHQLVMGEPIWARRWTEEIFADVFGCLAWGHTAAAASAIDMIRDNVREHYIHDDGDHPPDAIRFYSYLEVLDFLKDLSAETLTKNYDRLHQRRGKPNTLSVRDKNGKLVDVLLPVLESTLRRIARAFAKMLFERVPELKAKWPKGKTIDLDVILADSPDVLKEKLYADFEESLDSDLSSAHDSICKSDQLHFSHRPWFIMARDAQSLPTSKPENEWEGIFAADGWTIAGPETLPVGDG
ncbi:MAG: hypothetical protein M9928_15870 [Anaerolineae bacterium]|nr:hypothetical protein [Anaerolineae bacterium]MCO5195642.1 hypothetical protein [Anaerolineae bacterium]MCO5198709.1 hypothetical protein [Anaerolineae bacterium]MCO5206514.1 hypothetical protein [Anaerolineae bacterium]